MQFSAMFYLWMITIICGCAFSRPLALNNYENWPSDPFAENEEYWGLANEQELSDVEWIDAHWDQQNDDDDYQVYITNEFQETDKQEFTDHILMEENDYIMEESDWDSEDPMMMKNSDYDDEWRAFQNNQQDQETPVYAQVYPAVPQSYPDSPTYPVSEQDRFNYINTESMWDDVNSEMESQSHEDERERITDDIDAAYKQIIEAKNKLEALEKQQDKDGNVTECKKTMCSPCDGKQRCVSRNEWGDCILEESDVKECCHIDYEPRCMAMKEVVRDEIEQQIVEVTAQLEEIEEKLEEYANELAELEKKVLHPN